MKHDELLTVEIKNLHEAIARLQTWIDKTDKRGQFHGRLLTLYGGLLSLLGVGITVLLSKLTIHF